MATPCATTVGATRWFHALTSIEALTIAVFERPFTLRIATALDVFATTLANHGGYDYIAQARIFCITPTLNKPVFEALRVGLLISMFSPVCDMTLLVFVHFEHFLVMGILLSIRALIQAATTVKALMIAMFKRPFKL